MAKVTIYTDGSANNGTHDKGGYGVYMDRDGDVQMFSGGQFYNTTSARTELLGALHALKKCEPGDYVSIFIDNQYVVNSFALHWIFTWERQKWKNGKNNKAPFIGMRANYDLLKQILIQYRRLNGKVSFKWVRGHDGLAENEICDILAKQGGSAETLVKDCELDLG